MTSIYLKNIPEDLAEFILKNQWDIKIKKKIGKYSQSQTVIHIIKEYKKIVETPS